MADLRGLVAVVTGAGRGIGREVAALLASAGASVAAVARSADELNQTASLNARILPFPCDVADEAAVVRMAAAVKERVGEPGLVVNNAGVFFDAPFCQTPLDEWRRLFDINVMGAVHCVRAFLPAMLERGQGRIINVCSTASHRAYKGQSAYCASKHALLGLSRALAMETQGTGVRIHCVSPGGVDTRLVRDSGRDVDLDAYMRPEEIAEVIVFLAGMSGKAQIDDVIIRRVGGSMV